VSANWTRVTQCTATGRPAARAARTSRVNSSSGGSAVSSSMTLTGPSVTVGWPSGGGVPAGAMQCSRCASVPSATAPVRVSMARRDASGVASVKPVTPSSAAAALTRPRPGARVGSREASQSSIRHSRPVG